MADLADEVRNVRKRGWDEALRTYALWRMTGDPVDASRAAISVKRALISDGPLGRYLINHLGRLVELGPLVAPAVPVLHGLPEQDVRPDQHDRRSRIRDDDLLCDTIRAVLAAGSS